jgi:hypothetical protein
MPYPVVRRRLFSVLANNLKMSTYTGSCTCHKIEYNLNLNSPDDARTSLCHCKNCQVCIFLFNFNITRHA